MYVFFCFFFELVEERVIPVEDLLEADEAFLHRNCRGCHWCCNLSRQKVQCIKKKKLLAFFLASNIYNLYGY
ncbi:unnamed protein product [Prunus armeniaca]